MIWKKTALPRVAAVLSLGLMLPATIPAATPAAKRPAPQAAKTEGIEQIVRKYLLDHPEVILQSVQLFQQRQEEAKQQQVRATIAQHQRELTADSGNPVAQGPAQAGEPVTVVEFFDYRCGYCKKTADTVSQLAKQAGVRVVYKDLPILGPESLLAAQAALAAAKQGKHDAFHDALLRNGAPLTPELLAELAVKAGVDPVQMKADMASPEVAATLVRNQELAAKLNIQATPTFVVGTTLVPGAIDAATFQALVQAARAEAPSTGVKSAAVRQ